MRKILIAAGLAAALGTGYTASAFAQVKPETLVKQRQSAMVLVGKYWGPLGGMAAGRVPFDAAVVTRNIGYLEVIAKLPWDGFDASTQNEKSGALPEIWKEPAKFKAAADAMQTEFGKVAAAAKGGNEAAIKAALGDAGKTCGGCHNTFRQKQ